MTDERLIPAGTPERIVPYAGEPGERPYDDGFDHQPMTAPANALVTGGCPVAPCAATFSVRVG